MPQSVFFFGNGKAEGTRDMTSVLGGKGANLAEMTNLGVPVPSGFTIACSECIEYLNSGKYSDRLRAEVEGNVARLEKETGKKLGDPQNPLLVSVRSGAPISMPVNAEDSAHISGPPPVPARRTSRARVFAT